MGLWRTGVPLSSSSCPAARCLSRATAAAPRERRTLLLQSGMSLFRKTAYVSGDPSPSCLSLSRPFQMLTLLSSPLLSSSRGRQSSADLPPDYKRRPLPEEIRHSRDRLPSTHLPQPSVPRHLQQRAQQQQVLTRSSAQTHVTYEQRWE